MATTTNYSWTTPDDTDLVKNGASAIRTLGTAIDTTTKNLNPSTTLGDIEYRSSTANTNTRLGIGTSGQALTVVAGVPSWAASPTSVLTTTGDLLYASAANTLARRAIGSTGDVLTVSGGVPTWATPGGSNANFTLVNTGGTSLSGVNALTISGISNADKILVVIEGASCASSGNDMDFAINADTASNYFGNYFTWNVGSAYSSASAGTFNRGGTMPRIAGQSNNSSSTINASIYINGANSSGQKVFQILGGASGAGGSGHTQYIYQGRYNSSSTVSSVRIISVSANWTGGTIYVYTSA